MKDRNFNTKKLAESVKALVKAAHIKHSLLIKGLHMKSYFYKVINGEQTI